MVGRHAVAVLGVTLLLLSSSLAVPVHGDADPVPFDQTFTLGMTDATLRTVEARDLSVPRVEAYYSGFEYVVGYNGLRAFVTERERTGHERQFGRPVALYVSDYTGTNVSLTDEGYLRATEEVGFAPAAETYVVLGSRARLPDGPVPVPFADRSAATAFADEHGGEVLAWDAALDRIDPSRRLTRERFEADVARRTAWADAAASDARDLLDRPVSVVVGEDAPTVQAAVEAAPPNTTVRIPAGTYAVDNVTVDEPLTLRGAGPATRLVGDGNGSVIRVGAARSAVADLRVEGVGSVGSPSASPNATEGADVGWSRRVELAYGRGDAGVKLFGANDSLVRNVTVETPASGLVSLASHGAVVENVTVRGAASPDAGFMGVVAMYEPMVVQNSAFRDGRDGVYTHRADGIVVRDNYFAGGRYGVHTMYTGHALVANNTVRNERIGVIVMTRPTGNLVVGNDVRRSEVGVSMAGSLSYAAGNVVADNVRGIDLLGYRSLVTHNTVVGNELGLRGASAIPTTLVTANDVVGNERPARGQFQTVRVWTVAGAGNYWGPLPGDAAGAHYAQAYRPTGTVGRLLHDAPGAWTLGQSPAVAAVREIQDTVPGLRSGGVVDVAPRVRPARPAVLERVRGNASSAPEVGA
jgi:nitrous oxidase accessory protein NosD